jgi:hypothetical protein
LYLIPRNILANDPSASAWVIGLVLVSVGAAAVGAILVLLRLPVVSPRTRALSALVAALATLPFATAVVTDPVGVDRIVALHIGAGLGVLNALATAIGPTALVAAALATSFDDHRGPRDHALLAVAFVAALAYSEAGGGDILATPGAAATDPLYVVGFPVAMLALVAAGLVHLDRRRRVAGYTLAFGPLGLYLVVALVEVPAPIPGIVGVARSIAAGVLAYVILQLLPHAAPKRRRRLVRATTALALLFVVAQIAQNFLTAESGLLLGGVVTGAFVLVAPAVQRAWEREERTLVPAEAVASSAIEAFRAAVRGALVDGPMTSAKEEHLADVAHHLGLSPRDMVRVRREVEAEKAAR